LLAFARRRDYRHRSGSLAQVDFVCQGMTESLRQADGSPVPPASVDVINTSGVIGHHLTPQTNQPLLTELQRVLREDGVAMLDIGPTMSARTLRRMMGEARFVCLGHYRSWFADRTGEMVFRRGPAQHA
jgi:SAM-dependent methyltransferase